MLTGIDQFIANAQRKSASANNAPTTSHPIQNADDGTTGPREGSRAAEFAADAKAMTPAGGPDTAAKVTNAGKSERPAGRSPELDASNEPPSTSPESRPTNLPPTTTPADASAGPKYSAADLVKAGTAVLADIAILTASTRKEAGSAPAPAAAPAADPKVAAAEAAGAAAADAALAESSEQVAGLVEQVADQAVKMANAMCDYLEGFVKSAAAGGMPPEGMPPQGGQPEGGPAGGPAGAPGEGAPVDIEQLAAELEASGMTPEQVLVQLVREGAITAEQAQQLMAEIQTEGGEAPAEGAPAAAAAAPAAAAPESKPAPKEEPAKEAGVRPSKSASALLTTLIGARTLALNNLVQTK